MRVQQLGDLGPVPTVLRLLTAAARESDRPAPAALVGSWFGARAIIAPSISVRPVLSREAFNHNSSDAIDAPPGVVGGGWIGYLGYPDLTTEGGAPRLPDAAGGWTDAVLRLDDDECWWYESLLDQECPEWILHALTQPRNPVPWSIDWTAPEREHHRIAVELCLEAIAAGEVYQACVCTQFRGTLSGDPLDFFADAITQTAPARAAFVSGTWGAVASLSPELFLRRNGIDVQSSPIKGTLAATEDPTALLTSVKDVAENIMITDLVRNDLGRLAVTGTVTVPELLTVHPAPGVWHLVSTVAAQVPPETTVGDLLEATFPPASVTGTPKTRARQLLQQWERHHRGVYCGTVGMLSPAAGLELNVAIRTVEIAPDGTAVLGVGGGITADSDVDAEWQECLHKAAATVALTATGVLKPAL
ncbi:aminodeoxychorismate synthase component I [Mycobacterium sp. CBMA271]|uniref:aminodeoxychorismate synthase component I n=1 Tax=unclassified Mycobacteroides TaxID=2618759 RepID=UPI0012DD7F48|nr:MULTISPECIES: aminodeoxychorismate synthase component I [unclassified Mycobacteroides]MUM15596.1 aminodeoxychorismate synthase, component I [Mycobacteroides sp. CBMA 326]MUM17391.1 aminodeoxychorismate synthase, component I [Mycobacteroides sp. CBMA 326]MUM21866.1 aminodeoxychorismate synthase component I [Mycobacteroides sp. CBMA 271]